MTTPQKLKPILMETSQKKPKLKWILERNETSESSNGSLADKLFKKARKLVDNKKPFTQQKNLDEENPRTERKKTIKKIMSIKKKLKRT